MFYFKILFTRNEIIRIGVTIEILQQSNHSQDEGVHLSCSSEADYEVLKWIIADIGTE
jgi:hypothetical protein